MLIRGPLVRSNYDTVLKNYTNLRGEVNPEENHSIQNSQSTGQMKFVLYQYQLAQKPMLPSVGYSALF